MQKIVGSILIITASTGIGLLKGMDLQKYLGDLQCLRELFLMLRSEIKYTKAPLGEAFTHIGKRLGGEYGRWLLMLARKLEEKQGKTFWEIWNHSVEDALLHTKLKKNDLEQLKSLGRNMGYLDEEMQLGTIHLYLEQLNLEIQRTRESLESKKRLCNCLGVMGGIFLVVILI